MGSYGIMISVGGVKVQLDPIGNKKIVTKMYGTFNKHGKTQRNFLTKKIQATSESSGTDAEDCPSCHCHKSKLTTPTTNPISAYFQSPQSWIPIEFLKIFDFLDLTFSIFQLLQAWGTTFPPALLAGSWVFTHKTESPRAQLASLATKTPFFFVTMLDVNQEVYLSMKIQV